MSGHLENEEDVVASLTDPQYKTLIPPPRYYDAPSRTRRMAYGIPLTYQNVRWSRFFTTYWKDTPNVEERMMDFSRLGHMAYGVTRAMLRKARKIWPSCETHYRTFGYVLAFADNTVTNPVLPPPDVVANIQKVLTLEDAAVGWYTI